MLMGRLWVCNITFYVRWQVQREKKIAPRNQKPNKGSAVASNLWLFRYWIRSNVNDGSLSSSLHLVVTLVSVSHAGAAGSIPRVCSNHLRQPNVTCACQQSRAATHTREIWTHSFLSQQQSNQVYFVKFMCLIIDISFIFTKNQMLQNGFLISLTLK